MGASGRDKLEKVVEVDVLEVGIVQGEFGLGADFREMR